MLNRSHGVLSLAYHTIWFSPSSMFYLGDKTFLRSFRIYSFEFDNMWSNLSVNNSEEYVQIGVIRAVTPDYRTALTHHRLPPLPYTLTIDRSGKTDLVLEVHTVARPGYPESTHTYFTWPNDWMNDNTSDFIGMQSKVSKEVSEYNERRDNRLLSKLKGQSLPIVMAWRERKETADLLYSVVNRLTDALKVVRHPKQFVRTLYKGYKRPVLLKVMERRALKARASFYRQKKWPNTRKPHVGDLFLQYQFAWKPLIMDIQDGLNAVANTEKHLRGGSVKVSYNKSGTVNGTGGRGSGLLKLKCEYQLFGHMKLFWDVDSYALASLSQIQTLPSTMWDSVPYSFVVDWFVDVSDYLELRNATLGLSFRNGYKSIALEKRFTSESAGPQWSEAQQAWYYYTTAWPERYQFSFQRQILSSFPDPHLTCDFSPPSSLTHMTEGAVLAHQAIDRFRRALSRKL